jgi:hypothetical protein
MDGGFLAGVEQDVEEDPAGWKEQARKLTKSDGEVRSRTKESSVNDPRKDSSKCELDDIFIIHSQSQS